MPQSRLTPALFAALFLMNSIVFAAEKTLTTKVRSVDTSKNVLKLDDLELDVTRKTKSSSTERKRSLPTSSRANRSE